MLSKDDSSPIKIQANMQQSKGRPTNLKVTATRHRNVLCGRDGLLTLRLKIIFKVYCFSVIWIFKHLFLIAFTATNTPNFKNASLVCVEECRVLVACQIEPKHCFSFLFVFVILDCDV